MSTSNQIHNRSTTMSVAEMDTEEAVADEKRSRKQARKEAKLARKLARQQARAARVAVCQEQELEAEPLAQLLEELAAGVRSGTVSVKDERHEAVLQAAGPACVCVKARRGRKRSRLSVRIVWSPIEHEPTPAEEPNED
jgi:amphi-Trp domain-containing protein